MKMTDREKAEVLVGTFTGIMMILIIILTVKLIGGGFC